MLHTVLSRPWRTGWPFGFPHAMPVFLPLGQLLNTQHYSHWNNGRNGASILLIPVASLVSQWRLCSASLCILVLTDEAVAASGSELRPLLETSDGSVGATGSLAGAEAFGCAWEGEGLGEQDLTGADSMGCSFSRLETSTSVLSEQRFLEGDGFVQDFAR